MSPQAKASQNSFKRPLKTSKLNPYAMRQTGYDETRISPKIAALKGQFGKTGSGYGQGGMSLSEIAEAKANYIPRSAGKAGTREAAAEMLKRYRKTKMLSRADAAAIVEFAAMDLGQEPGKYDGCSPISGSSKPKKYYPTLYVSGVKKLDLPLKGRATIEYRIRSTTDRQDEDGNLTKSADIEVLSIDPAVAKIAPKAGGKAIVTKTEFRRADAAAIVEFAYGDRILNDPSIKNLPAKMKLGILRERQVEAQGIHAARSFLPPASVTLGGRKARNDKARAIGRRVGNAASDILGNDAYSDAVRKLSRAK